MEVTPLFALVLASAINSAIPGPCIAMTIGRSARGGLGAGGLVAIGVVGANLVLCSVALSILLGLFVLSPSFYVVMKWVGIFTLVILAARMFLNACDRELAPKNWTGGRFRNLTEGLVVGLSSPFNLIFLLALLPQLVSAEHLTALGSVFVTLAVLLGAAVSLTGAVLIGAISGGMFRKFGRQLERLGALSMIGFALLAGMTPIV